MKHPTDQQIEQAYALAKARYDDLGVDTDQALERLKTIPISLHCWQGDDVRGFESPEGELSGGIATTGNYPGRARTPDQLRSDLDKAYSLIPGTHRLNLHAIYAETGEQAVPRNELRPEHFANWLEWAKANDHGLDFNSGSNTASLAASSASPSGRRWARPASPMCGSRMDTRIRRSTARLPGCS